MNSYSHSVIVSLAAAIGCLTLVGCGSGAGALVANYVNFPLAMPPEPEDEEEDDEPQNTPPANRVAANKSAPPTGAANPASRSNPAIAKPPASQPAAVAGATVESTTRSKPDRPTIDQPASQASLAIDSQQDSPGLDQPTGSGPAIGGLLPIADRKPDSALTIDQRRKMSAENVQTITSTLVAWIEQGPMIQPSVQLDKFRRKGLSWRVKILPLLGYEELYRKFNLDEAWDSPTNKPLLEYIPNEFVSPERFDTFTNYQLFVNGTALFSEKEAKNRSEVSDGPSVLMMAEVDDAAAVPWTAPFDYDITEEPLDRAIGNLRADGVFVGWMTGYAALWPKPINTSILFRALTFEAGDNANFSAFMGYPPTVEGGSGRPSLGNEAAAGTSVSGTTSIGPGLAATAGNASINSANRTTIGIALPSQESILAAEAKMRDTYASAFEQARTAPEFASLAKLIYDQITGGNQRRRADDDGGPQMPAINMPPAELYVGLRTAFNVAIRAGDPNLAYDLINELEERFQIDRNEFESRMFNGFLGKKGSLRTNHTKAAKLIPVLEQLIALNIQQDDFRNAELHLGYGLPVTRSINNPETNYRWKVLEERVTEGKKRFPQIAKHIQTLKANPEDPTANKAAGWYMCVIKGNWNQGAQMLAKSDDRKLRALAILELQQDTNMQRHLTLGDGWWQYAELNQDDALVFQSSMQRARKWYLSAADGLGDGLDRIKANNRLERISRMIGDPKLDPVGSGLGGPGRF